MIKNSFYIVFFGIALFFTSCSTPSYYIPAISANDMSYMPKPMGSDSIKVKNYVSASVSGMDLPYAIGSLTMGMINYNRAHTLNNINIAYGAFGFAGKTSDGELNSGKATSHGFDSKGFLGGGFRTSIGYYDEAGNAEFRILSWENALSFESGAYSDLRKRLSLTGDPEILSSTKTTIFTTGGATELIWHSKRNFNNHYAFRIFYGFTPGLNKSLRNSTYNELRGGAFDFAFYFKMNKLYGIINSGANKGFSSKLSLGYSF